MPITLKPAPIRVSVFGDRVEVENPGVLLPGLSIADLCEVVSRVRNRVIARVFHALGLSEQWRTGVAGEEGASTAAVARQVSLSPRAVQQRLGAAAANEGLVRVLASFEWWDCGWLARARSGRRA